MSRRDDIAGNLAIAEKFYDGYHNSVARGRLENVFDPADLADEWTFCSPYVGGELRNTGGAGLAEGAAANHALISERITDYKMDDFRAWPTERGVAWRWRVNGHGLDGTLREFWEQLFLWTDADAKVTRFEFYDDWHGFPQALVYAYETPLDELTKLDRYGAPPWTPPGRMTINQPAAPPRADPPANDRVAHNLALARKFFDGYHRSVERGAVEGVFLPEDFAPGWTLFSPWFGEVVQPLDQDYSVVADLEHKKIWRRLPDYKMDDFEAWPTDDGVAWRWRVNGHGVDGTYYEFWESMFADVDEDGRITRFEFFDDWQGFPQTLGFITGLALEELWDSANYAAFVAGD